MNGGIDTSTQPADRFDRILDTVQNTDSYEKVFRHDVQLGIATNFWADSNAVNSLTFYQSTNLREYRVEKNRSPSNTIFLQQNQYSRWYGVKLAGHRIVNAPFSVELRRAPRNAPLKFLSAIFERGKR